MLAPVVVAEEEMEAMEAEGAVVDRAYRTAGAEGAVVDRAYRTVAEVELDAAWAAAGATAVLPWVRGPA